MPFAEGVGSLPQPGQLRHLSIEHGGDHVYCITLNRPEVRNALNTRMAVELTGIFEAFGVSTHDVRCIVVTGAGDQAFCAGGDLKERNGMTDAQWESQHLIFERMLRSILNCPVPVIGAVNGFAFGGGCEIAAACDFIYAAEEAKFALPEVTLGIMPGLGGTQNLPRAIGARRAKEVLLTGNPFSAGQALEWGLANAVVPRSALTAEVLKIAQKIAANAPLSTSRIKQSVSRGVQMSLTDGLAFEIEAYNRLIPTADRREGISAFNERRKPEYKGR